jgi:hypothetical protein
LPAATALWIMPDGVRSFDEYREWIRQLTRQADLAGALRFCAWSLRRFLGEFGPDVWDGLSSDERITVGQIVAELEDSASRSQPIEGERARRLQGILEGLGPHDDVQAIEVRPDATEFRSAIFNALDFRCTGDPSALSAISENLVNARDYRLEPMDEAYSFENMFTYPELERELALQQRQLRGSESHR